MDTIVQVNQDSVEPNEYFKVLKENVSSIDTDSLQKQLEIVAKHILLAKDIGQQSLVDKLSFSYDVIVREQILLASGFSKFVYQDDIKKFTDKVKQIKIIELERYPRTIPIEQMDKIKKAKSITVPVKTIKKVTTEKKGKKVETEVEEIVQKPLIDKFCVIFTDLTNNDYKTDKEKEYVRRNRDPVVLGYFEHEKSGIKHDRFYLITDWEDEFCDLTFGRMIEKMANLGIEHPGYEISTDHTYVQEVVRATLDNMGSRSNVSFAITTGTVESSTAFQLVPIKSESFWSKLKKWRSKK